MNYLHDSTMRRRENIPPDSRLPGAQVQTHHSEDGEIERLTSELAEAGHSLHVETEKHGVLQEVLRMQNRVLVRTLSSLVLKESDSAKFLDRLLDAITHELDVHSCAVWSIDASTGLATLERTAFNGTILSGLSQLKHPTAGREAKRKSRLFAKMMATGPVQIDDVSSTPLLEPAIRRWLKSQKVKSMLCMPLLLGKKMTGALTVRVAESDGMLQSKTHLVHALAILVSLAVRLNGLLERRQENATMRERGRLASELHDSLAQQLAVASLQLEAADRALSSGAERAHSHLGLARNMVRQSSEELRRAVWAMRPLPLVGHSLPEALRQLAGRLSGHMSLGAEFVLRGRPQALSEELESNLLRIAQEAVNNSIRHADATKIKIQLAYWARKILLTVMDNGVGFKTGAAQFRHGAGLENMRERAAGIGARFLIHSSRRRGTTVTTLLPVPAGT